MSVFDGNVYNKASQVSQSSQNHVLGDRAVTDMTDVTVHCIGIQSSNEGNSCLSVPRELSGVEMAEGQDGVGGVVAAPLQGDRCRSGIDGGSCRNRGCAVRY
jgi:hypothetical protein